MSLVQGEIQQIVVVAAAAAAAADNAVVVSCQQPASQPDSCLLCLGDQIVVAQTGNAIKINEVVDM